MKKLLKSEVYRSCTLFTKPTDIQKMIENSKFFVTVHAQYINTSLCFQLHVPKKKKKIAEEENADAKYKQAHSITKDQTLTLYP